MKKNVLVNGKVMTIEVNEVVTTETTEVETLAITPERHSLYAKKVTGNIHTMVPIIESVVLRAEKDDNNEIVLYGEVYKTKGTNSPNIRGLMKYCNDFDNDNIVDIQLHKWDEKEKMIVTDNKVTCNDKMAKTLYVETYSHTNVIFSALNNDIKSCLGKYASEAEVKAEKDKRVYDIINKGLVIDSNGNAFVNDGTHEGVVLETLKWTPSNMRNESILMSSIPSANSFAVLNKVSGGVLEEAMAGETEVGKAIKASARLGILSAPSVAMSKSANDKFGYVIVLDEILGAHDYDADNTKKLKDTGIKIDNNISDGAAQYGVEFIADSFAKLGRRMTIEQALYFAAQTRANVFFTKVFGEAKTQFNMQFRLRQLINKYGEDKVLRVKAGQDVSGLNIDDYKVIIIGNEDCLGTIIDYNGGKLLKNISLQTMVQGNVDTYLLDIAKCSDTFASGQMLSKFLIADLEATIKAINKCVIKELDNKFQEVIEGDLDVNNCSLAQFILRHVPEGNRNAVALESMINEQLTFNKSIVKKSKVAIDAIFQRALFDDSCFLTAGKIDSLLGKNRWTGRLECYSLDVELKYADEIAAIENNETLTEEEKDKAISELLTGVAFKYPSPSSDENAIITYVTRKQIKNKIKALVTAGVIKGREAKVLEDDFLNTSYGVIKIGSDNTLKHKLAGMDTDYDGIAVVFEKDLVDILLNKNKDNDGVATIISR